MVKNVLKRSFEIITKFPVRLWGISLLSSVVCVIIALFGLFVPIITVPIILTISTGMSVIYLNGYYGLVPEAGQLFDGFKGENAPRVIGGSCWLLLWKIIWFFVPIANIVKSLQYAFTPYILMKRPEVSATEAIKVSKRETYGFKGKMFLTNICITLAVSLASGILSALAIIPYIGILFGIILFLFNLAVTLFLPLFQGLVDAGFYDEAQRMKSYNEYNNQNNYQNNYNNQNNQGYNPQYNQCYGNVNANDGGMYGEQVYQAPVNNASAPEAQDVNGGWKCNTCGIVNSDDSNFCIGCGRKNPGNE